MRCLNYLTISVCIFRSIRIRFLNLFDTFFPISSFSVTNRRTNFWAPHIWRTSTAIFRKRPNIYQTIYIAELNQERVRSGIHIYKYIYLIIEMLLGRLSFVFWLHVIVLCEAICAFLLFVRYTVYCHRIHVKYLVSYSDSEA